MADQPKTYKWRDPQTGQLRTITSPRPLSMEELQSAVGQASGRPFATAAVSSTATVPEQERPTRTLGEVASSVTRPLGYVVNPQSAMTADPRQVGEDVGTALELGLPLLAAPLPPVARTVASGLLQGTGTAIKSAASGAPPGRMLKEAGQSALTGMVGQGIGEGIAKGVAKVAAPFANQVDKGSLALAKQYGIKPTPSEVINETTLGSNIAKTLEDISSKSIGGVPIIKTSRFHNFEALQAYKKDVLDKIAPETRPTALKDLVTGAVENNEQAFQNVATNLYAKVDKAAKSANVTPSTASVRTFAMKALADIPEQERIAAGRGGAEASALVGQLERIAQLPETMSFKDAQFYRSQLLATVRADRSPIGGQVKGSASRLAQLFDGEMERAAKAAGSDAYAQYQKAGAFWKHGKDLFNADVVAGLAKQEPEQLAAYVFSPKSGEAIGKVGRAVDPRTFRTIKQAVPNDTWQRFKRAGLENIIESKVFQRVNQQTGDQTLRGANLYQALKDYGDETLNAWLNPAEKKAVFDFAKLASRVNTNEPSVGMWGMTQAMMATQAAIAGPVMGEAGVGLAGAGFLLGTPALYAKLITSDTGRRWLTEGFRIRPGTQEALRFASRFTAYLNSDANRKQ